MEPKESRTREGGKPERRSERTAQMMLVVPVVTVPKLSLIPVWSSSEHRERKLTDCGQGVQGTWLKLHHCSRALPTKSKQNTPLDSISKSTRATTMTSSASPIWHGNHILPSALSSATTSTPLPLVPAAPSKMLILRKILDTEE